MKADGEVDPGKYDWLVGGMWITMMCAPGTVFDYEKQCQCVNGGLAVVNQGTVLILLLK